jgi:hypothetical protein
VTHDAGMPRRPAPAPDLDETLAPPTTSGSNGMSARGS